MFHAFVDQSTGLIFISEKSVSVVLLQFGVDEDAVPVLLGLIVILKVFKHNFCLKTQVSKNIR